MQIRPQTFGQPLGPIPGAMIWAGSGGTSIGGGKGPKKPAAKKAPPKKKKK
jgi:hypothetical protein